MKISYFAIYLLTSFTMIGCGGGGDSSSPSPTPPTPTPTNQAPTADAGPDILGDEGASIVINGSANDSDGTILSYQWTQVSGPQVNANFTNTATLDVLLPLVDSDSIAVLRLTVTDDDGAESSDDVQITIINLTGGNTPPVVDAGDDITVSSGDNVSLVGTASDSDGSIVGYQWTQTSGSQVTINDSDSANASFTAPIVENDTTLSFQLTVTDNAGLVSVDTTNVTVQPSLGSDIGNLDWEVLFHDRIWTDIGIDSDDSVYLCIHDFDISSNRFINKINADGTLAWEADIVCETSLAITEEDTVYVGYSTQNGREFGALNKNTGSVEWIQQAASLDFTVDGNGNLSIFKEDENNTLGIYTYSVEGALVSTYIPSESNKRITNSRITSTTDGVLFFNEATSGSGDEIVAVKDGVRLWTTTNFNNTASSLIVHPSGLLVGTTTELSFFDLSSGQELWTFSDGIQGYYLSTVIDEGGTIYHWSNFNLYQINPATGEQVSVIELNDRSAPSAILSLFASDIFHYRRGSDGGGLIDKAGNVVFSDEYESYGDFDNERERPMLFDYIVTQNDITYITVLYDDLGHPNYGKFGLRAHSDRDIAGNAIHSTRYSNLKRTNSSTVNDLQVPGGNRYTISSNGLLLKASAADAVLSNGNINPDNYNPAYTFESSNEFSGSFSLYSESVDTYAYIVNAQNGQVLLENDDSDNSTNSRISFNGQPGKYVAVASAFQDGFGDLKIEMTFDDEAEIDVKELRTDKKLNPGNGSINPSSLIVQQDTFYVVNNVTQKPELEVVDPSNPVVGSGQSAQFTKEGLTYRTVRFTYTSCFDGGDSKIQFQTSSGQVTERNLAKRPNTVYTTGNILDIGEPELNSTLIMTTVESTTEVSESPPLAPGREPQCEIDDFENDWVLYNSTLDAKHILSQDGLENLMAYEHNLSAASGHFLDEENNFYGMYQGENGDNFQLNVPNENLADFETLLESFRVDPNFNPGGGTQPGDCESAWSGPDDPQFSPQCALACIYAAAGQEQGRAAACQILQNADPSYPGFCSACN